jgi:hypothetical protein
MYYNSIMLASGGCWLVDMAFKQCLLVQLFAASANTAVSWCLSLVCHTKHNMCPETTQLAISQQI